MSTPVEAPSRTSPLPSHGAGWRLLVAAPGPIGTALCVAGGALVIASAGVHLHLWSTGYRHIPTIGPLFLLQAVLGACVGLAVAITRRPVVALAGALFAAGTIGGLVISATVGLFNFKDSFSAPYATISLVLESAAVVVLLVATFSGLHQRHRAAA